MSIQDAEAYVRNLWDWKILNGCFGSTRIVPMDIDGAVERNGYFLFIETKEPGVPLKRGQEIFYTALAKKQGITVFLVWGAPAVPAQIQAFARNGASDLQDCDLDKLRRWVSRWFTLACSNNDLLIDHGTGSP